MFPPLKQTTLLALFLILFGSAMGGIEPRLVENKGQWADEVHFKALADGGYFYIRDGGIVVQQLEDGFFDHFHDWFQGKSEVGLGNTHTIMLDFPEGNFDNYRGEENLGRNENFLIGSDPAKHATRVQSYLRSFYENVYPEIDLRFDIKSDRLKYEFIVAPNADPTQIRADIKGAESIGIKEGRLIFSTSLGEIYEEKPFVYQLDENGRIKQVNCRYRLEGSLVTYEFPDGYDESRELVIDPEISFSTYVGSQADNFGFTASYDAEGNLYGGAIVFGTTFEPYPIEGGPFQQDYGGGAIDCGITKFSSDGTELLYSTYLGGVGNEAPHSLVVNENGELYVFGTTESINFPTSDDAYQGGFAGGTSVAGLGFSYLNGSDIFISRISNDGTDLLSSTYVGGSDNDGIGVWEPLEFNYGDIFRGEIVVAENGDIAVATVTESPDFPSDNGFSSNFNGQSSGAVFRLSEDLSGLVWSSSTGGGLAEAAYGLQIAPDGTLYVTGGTTNVNLISSGSGADPSYGGQVDGFIMRISADGSMVLNSTFVGTSQFDQTYFVQIDDDGGVYTIGQSLGNIEVSDGVYSNPSGRQFVQKYSPDLTTMEWSTTIGSNNGQINFSPSAFLVTNCNDIFISGWGGTTNGIAPAGGTTLGLPVTPDAFQPNTDGSDFYLMVLSENAEELTYATYFGGSSSAEHVDGGTSRFDKSGTVYQAVCAGCGGQDDFPSQPGVWSQTNPSSNCNLGVFKFKLSSVSAAADVEFSTEPLCTGEQANFTNLSADSDTYFWDFGDGETSTETDPVHIYTEPGVYEVSLLAEDSEGCLAPDSTVIELEVLPTPEVEFDFINSPICAGQELELGAVGADSYEWLPANLFLDNDAAYPIFIGNESASVTVTGTTACGTETLEIEIEVGIVEVELEEEVFLCPGESYQLNASGGDNYTWFPDEFMDDPNIPNPTVTPESDIAYSVMVSTDLGCEGEATVGIELLDPPPVLSGDTDYATCNSVAVQIIVSGGDNYSWSPADGLSDPTVSNPTANPSAETLYTVTSTNECGEGTLDILVRTESIDVTLETDSIGCFLTPIGVSATGGDTYRWEPQNLFANPTSESTTVEINSTTEISVTGFNEDGCFDQEKRLIQIYPREPIYLGLDEVIPYGGETVIESFSNFPVEWADSPHLSCLNCLNPVASPPETTTFYATIETPDGCIETDSVLVTVMGNIYVPNAFTPDGDGINDFFKAQGVDITEFKMEIFNRWGELLYVSNNIGDGWNGRSPNEDFYAPADVYPYRIVAREHTGDVFELTGSVTLVR